MNKETKEALEGAIDKWQKIARYLWLKRKVDRLKIMKLERGSENCPLCILFVTYRDRANVPVCSGCPVNTKTNKVLCGDTPYADFHYAKMSNNITEMKKYAKAEVKFLKSLRE